MRRFLFPVVLCALASCSTETPIGEQDGGRPPPLSDECGNGFDDDGDGRIDEDPCICGSGESQSCWTGERGAQALGACAAGTQDCSVIGSQEFGQWGECGDVVEPGTETCDGAEDEDCDGAVDEGCECEAGATRECDGSSRGPCSPGTQRCTDAGEWSGCEGAVGPIGEVCEDGVDNDCDGTVDDPSFCDCVPIPEVCGDGVDNDCDGVADEDPCRICVPATEVCNGSDDDCDGLVDEGVCADAAVPDGGMGFDAGMFDAGMCEPEVETCDGVDDDCDGVIDNGACTACACERWTGTTHELTLSVRSNGTARERSVEPAFDGDDTIALLFSTEEITVETEVIIEIHRIDGSTVATRSLATIPSVPRAGVFAPTQNGNAGTVAFGGDRFVATWDRGRLEPGLGTVHAAAIGRDGSMIVGPTQIADGGARIGGVAMLGDDAYVVFFRGTSTYVQHVDASLAAVGAPIELPGIGDSLFGIEVRTLDDAVAVIGTGAPGTTVRVAIVRASGLAGMSDLASISTSERRPYHASAATDGSGGAIICYQLDLWAISCRRIDLADASPTASAFDVLPISGPSEGHSRAWDVVAAGCAYQLVLGVGTGSGRQSAYRGYEIRPDDTVRAFTMDRQWAQSNQTFAAFETNAGGLLRVLEDHMITVQSCATALPEPDCETLRDDLTELVCGGCGGDPNICPWRGRTVTREHFTPIRCDQIDTVACRIALDSPECRDGVWVIPADCALPP